MKKFTRLTAILMASLIPFTAWANEWAWTTTPTPGSQNTIASQEGEEAEDYTDGTLSSMIILSEVMPNPEGTDNENEWIELYNAGDVNVNLGNWSLDDEEGGSSPYVFPADSVIEAQDFLVIYRTESKISLNNNKDDVRLFDFQGTLQDSVVYEGSPEGQSYARISLEVEGDSLAHRTRRTLKQRLIPQAYASTPWYQAPWEWTDEITQGTTNPIYYFITGTVAELMPFEDQVQLDLNGELVALSLNGLTINNELKTSLFHVGNTIEGYATKEGERLFRLKRFEVNPTSQEIMDQKSSAKFPYLLMMLVATLGFIYTRKKTKARLMMR